MLLLWDMMSRDGDTDRPATALASFSPISGVNGLRRLLSGRQRRRQTVKCAPLMSVRCVANAAADRFVHSVGFAPEKLGCYAEKTSELAVASCPLKSASIPNQTVGRCERLNALKSRLVKLGTKVARGTQDILNILIAVTIT